MAKIKLTPNHVRVIKHLYENRNWTHQSISNLFDNIISRVHITKIINNQRWIDIECPSTTLGQELYYRYLNKGNLD